MTVCIAALADLGRSMVMACDSMLSAGEYTGDAIADKMYPLSSQFQWWAMVSGGGVIHMPTVISAIVHKLFSLSVSTNTAENVQRWVAEAYQDVRSRHAEDMILSPLKITLEDFKSKKKWNPRIVEKLTAVELGCQLLVAGFDFSGEGCIFSVQDPGTVWDYGTVGWASVGNGYRNAEASLMYHSVNYKMELPLVLYHTCEAKFMAESAEGVGRHTVVKIASGRGRMNSVSLSEEFIDHIRHAWEIDGRPKVPRGYIDHLKKTLRYSSTTEATPSPQPPKGDSSPPPPSPESPGGSGES